MAVVAVPGDDLASGVMFRLGGGHGLMADSRHILSFYQKPAASP
jgi:hypothetical protein